MFLTLSEFEEHLLNMTQRDWQPLLELIPEIEKTEVFSEEKGGEEVRPGVFTFPYHDNSKVVEDFVQVAYRIRIVINFDWPGWDEGRSLASGDLELIDNIDLITACKLITALIRNDRFCDGALAESFESGLMLRILKRVKVLVG